MNQEFRNNLLKSGVAALISLAIVLFASLLILFFVDVAFDPGPPTREEDEGAYLMAAYSFVTFWSTIWAVNKINNLFNLESTWDKEFSIEGIKTNSTLIGWVAGSALFFALLYAVFAPLNSM